MHSVAQPHDIDAIHGGLADDGDGESDYGYIDQALAPQIMEDLEREWAMALNKEVGNGIEEEEEEEEAEQVVVVAEEGEEVVQEKEEEEKSRRMEGEG